MLTTLRYLLASPVTGPIATAVAVALAVTLGLAQVAWSAREARYQDRIAVLVRLADRQQAGLRTELASCQAARIAQRASPAPAATAPTLAQARRLLAQQPEGIDACARMESADRAVLSNLHP